MNQLYKVSEVKLSYKTKTTQLERVKADSPADCYKVLLNSWDKGQLEHKESFKVLLLNQSNDVLGIYTVAEGGISETIVDVRVVLQAAILANATSIVLAHNHPSGNLTPGLSDHYITEKIKEAARLLSISVYDHIIVGRNGYFSFAERKVL